MPWGRIDGVACVVIALVTVALAALHVRAYPTLSPFDELQHVDYVIKAGQFDVPRVNELVGQDALSEAACRGVDVSGIPDESGRRLRRAGSITSVTRQEVGARPLAQSDPPECGEGPFDPADFQENGVNTAARQLPLYYTPTGVASRAITATGVVDSQVTAARVVNSFWFAGAWSVIWYAMSLLGIRRPQRSVIVTMLIATPLILFHSATVNADGALMLTGAIALVAALQYDAGRLRPWSLLAIAIALYLVEPSVFLALCASAAFLAVRVIPRTEATLTRRLAPLLVFPLVLVLRRLVVPPVQEALFPAVPRTNRPTMFVDNALPGGRVDWSRIVEQYDAVLLPVNNPHLAPFIDEVTTRVFVDATNWFLIGAMAVAAFSFVRDRRVVWLSRVTFPTLLLAGPFYTLSFAVFSDSDFDTPGRFGLSMIPFIAVVAAAGVRWRWAMVVAWMLAIGSVVNTTVLLVRA